MNHLKRFKHHAHWILRIALASAFVFDSILKFTNTDGFAQMWQITYAETMAIALIEYVGGLLILAGGFSRQWLADFITRIGAAMQIPIIVGAIVLIHSGRWSFTPTQDFPTGGMQFQVTLALMALYFVVTGNDNRSGSPVSA